MSTVNINSLVGVMGFSAELPVASLSFNLFNSSGVVQHSVVLPSGLQYSVDSGENWAIGSLHTNSSISFSSSSSGSGAANTLLWDVKEDIPEYSGEVIVRLNLKETSGDSESGYIQTSSFNVHTVSPTVDFSVDEYVNDVSVELPIESTNSNYIRYKINDGDYSTWALISESLVVNIFSGDGNRNIYLQTRDNYYNLSSIVSKRTILYTTSPTDTYSKIIGSVPGEDIYTGIKIQNGAFVPDRSAIVEFFADSPLNLEMRIYGDIENPLAWTQYKTDDEIMSSEYAIILIGNDYNYDADRSVSIQFRDEAGNLSTITKTIRLNTKIFKLGNKNLRKPDASYDHQVLKLSMFGYLDIVAKDVYFNDVFTRRWQDIFYPESHKYPVNADGELNEQLAIAMGGVSNAQNDAVLVQSGAVVYDDELRSTTVNWTTDGTKNYRNLESSYSGNITHWIIDNTGYGDIELEIEHFYLNANSYGPPFNNIAPYKCDCLVVYNADEEGATTEVSNNDGTTGYVLQDMTKLKEIYAYTGEGNQVIDLTTGYPVNANSNGGFTVPTLSGINRICLVLYSDYSMNSSGFKIKAGPKHSVIYKNYHIDEKNGELWLHQSPTGQSYSGEVRMIYDYYEADVDYDLDGGKVILRDTDIPEDAIVKADYTYYKKQEDMTVDDFTRKFITTNDDLVDYISPTIYITPKDQTLNKESVWVNGGDTSGKLANYYLFDTDRGLLEFFSGSGYGQDEFYFVPQNARITADYTYHTFFRLSNDGYGTLFFNDKTIVADDTPVFPDFTWVDVKIVNEGGAILEDGKISFLCRGYDNDNNGTVDQVLDLNRPWDVQEGTKEETYEKVAMQPLKNFTFSLSPSRTEAYNIFNSWRNQPFGFDVYPRTRFYGRVVWFVKGTSSSYPNITVGRKTFSSELSGKFYVLEV